jgi:hypothetical protein
VDSGEQHLQLDSSGLPLWLLAHAHTLPTLLAGTVCVTWLLLYTLGPMHLPAASLCTLLPVEAMPHSSLVFAVSACPLQAVLGAGVLAAAAYGVARLLYPVASHWYHTWTGQVQQQAAAAEEQQQKLQATLDAMQASNQQLAEAIGSLNDTLKQMAAAKAEEEASWRMMGDFGAAGIAGSTYGNRCGAWGTRGGGGGETARVVAGPGAAPGAGTHIQAETTSKLGGWRMQPA